MTGVRGGLIALLG